MNLVNEAPGFRQDWKDSCIFNIPSNLCSCEDDPSLHPDPSHPIQSSWPVLGKATPGSGKIHRGDPN